MIATLTAGPALAEHVLRRTPTFPFVSPRVYVALISAAHRRVVAPAMLTHAVDWALASTATKEAVPCP